MTNQATNLPPITPDQAIKIAEVYSRMALGVSRNNGPRAETYARIADGILQRFIKDYRRDMND